jgi:hypothetical protein
MKIQKDELYAHLGEFLKSKGIELKEGSYTKGIHAGCSLLADAINLSQAGIERAKAGLDKKFDQVRQVIHEKTAPKAPGTPNGSARKPAAESAENSKRAAKSGGKPSRSVRRKKGR